MQTKENSLVYFIDEWLEKTINLLGISIFIIMVISVWLGVFYRYVLVDPLIWTEELAIYGMIWLGYLGMGLATKHNEHPALTYFTDKMPLWLRKICKILANMGVVAFLLVAIIWGFDYAINSGKFRMTGALGIAMTIPQLSVPVGSLLALCQLCLRWIKERHNTGVGTSNLQQP